jgi:arylsulfatase A-like enzyme
LLIRWPGHIQSGLRASGLVSQVDIVPTILSAIGEQLPPDTDGVDALPLLRGDAGTVRDEAIIECTDDPRGLRLKTIVTRDRKLTCYHGQDFGELYDLAADPGEATNLWDDGQYARDRQELLGRLLDHMEPLERRQERISYA